MSKFTSIAALTVGVAVTALSSPIFATPILTLTEKIVSQRNVANTTVLKTINSSSFTATAPGAFDYQIEVDGTISNLDPGTSFGSVAFDVVQGNNISHPTTSAYAWKAANPTWVDDGGDPANGVFRITGDQGSSTTDLLGIIAVTQNDATQDSSGTFGGDSGDPRLGLMTASGMVGFSAPLKLGTFVVTWDGSANTTLSLGNVQFAELDDTTLLYDTTITNAVPGSIVINGASFTAAAGTGTGPNTPEPASLGILAIGGAALLARRNKKA